MRKEGKTEGKQEEGGLGRGGGAIRLGAGETGRWPSPQVVLRVREVSLEGPVWGLLLTNDDGALDVRRHVGEDAGEAQQDDHHGEPGDNVGQGCSGRRV